MEAEFIGPKGFTSRVRVHRNLGFAVPDFLQTLIPFDTELYDDLDEYDLAGATFRFSPRRAGYYLFTLNVGFVVPALAGYFHAFVIMNLASYVCYGISELDNINFRANSISGICYMTPNDYAEAYVFQQTGAPLNLLVALQLTSLSIHRLS